MIKLKKKKKTIKTERGIKQCLRIICKWHYAIIISSCDLKWMGEFIGICRVAQFT